VAGSGAEGAAASPFQTEIEAVATSTAYGRALSLCDRLSPAVQSCLPFKNPGSTTGIQLTACSIPNLFP